MESGDSGAVATGGGIAIGAIHSADIHVHRPGTLIPHQLPRNIEAFTGRTPELQDLLEHLAPATDRTHEPRAILVTGMAGVGKSALVLQAAHQAVREGWFPSGSLYMDLRGYDQTASIAPSDVLELALRSLDATLTPERIPIDVHSRAGMYRTVLAGLPGAVLIVVENVATAEEVRHLLPADPRHRIVITSRHQLPSLMARTISLDPLSKSEAVHLLEAAIRSSRPEDSRVAGDPQAAAIIVDSAGRLPLAVAILAGRLSTDPTLPLAELAQELLEAAGADQRLEHLGDGEVSVAAAIELSYRNLPPEQAQLLALLAVTVGRRFSTDAVAAGLNTDTRDARRTLRSLAAAHLIEDTSQPDSWAMHDLIRAFGTSVAAEAVDAAQRDQVRDRILDFTLRHSDAADDGTGFFTTRIGARPLAGVHSDSPSQDDRLGVVRDVEVLAELIAATETQLPLSIALIGNWGAGKSSLMLQIEQQVTKLAERSQGRPNRTAFVSSVRQVRFNAWHYSDTNVWTGLITHLFTSLASDNEDETPSAAPDPQQAKQDRETLRTQLNQQEETERQLADQLAAADNATPAPGQFASLASPIRSYRVLRATALQASRDLRFSLPVLALWLALAALAAGAWLTRGPLTAALTSLLATAAAAAPLRPLWLRLRTAHRELLRFTERQYGELAAKQRDIRTTISGLRERLALVDAAARLGEFLQERADGTAYQPYRGVLGQAHADLQRLSRDLAAVRTQWKADGTKSAPPLQRIVLYIDDLDRCSPDRVVHVLQAVHLMLGLDLFVVVVAVDARWLIHSLRHHHSALFQHENMPDAATISPDTGGLATTVDYLDKIFQIPYALNPPTAQTMGRYLTSLLPNAHPETAPQAPAARSEPPASSPAEEASTDEGPVLPRLREPVSTPPASDSATSEPRAESSSQSGTDAAPHSRNEHVDLMPLGLRIGAVEAAFMAQLGRLLPTPRAAKRLVNLYRLVRIGVPATDLPAFASTTVPAPYQAVQILLAVLAGSPRAAEELFRRLLACTNDSTNIMALLEDNNSAPPAYERMTRTLRAVLHDLEQTQPIPTTVDQYRRWCTDLARYSFHTHDLTPASDPPIGQP
ncbi:P-loop NTPase fold protein [Streptomyces sp. NPDC001663]|uniref:P-loop NTPase fold protein n=1 Tax=Streptomyces sp. NPDC001663 TaxID=3364597 RepID=UPI0036980187